MWQSGDDMFGVPDLSKEPYTVTILGSAPSVYRAPFTIEQCERPKNERSLD